MSKEIIIDGVDVAGCVQLVEEPFYPCGLGGECKGWENCYYKQLKRLEQENAKLKAELQKFKDMAKKGLDEFKDVGGCWGCGLQLQLNQDLEAYKQSEQEATEIIAELKAENEKLTSWLESSEKQKKELCNVIHKKKEQIQTMKYMLFDEKEIPKDKFTMYYRIAQNERRTKSHRDLCTNIVKKYKQTLQEIKAIAEENKDTAQYGGICKSILMIITKTEEE